MKGGKWSHENHAFEFLVIATRIANRIYVNLDRVLTSRGSEKYEEVLEFRVSATVNAECIRGDQSLRLVSISSFGFSLCSFSKAALGQGSASSAKPPRG